MSELHDSTTGAGEPEHDPLPEGEERPPPGTRTAAIVRWSLVALMAFAAAGASPASTRLASAAPASAS